MGGLIRAESNQRPLARWQRMCLVPQKPGFNFFTKCVLDVFFFFLAQTAELPNFDRWLLSDTLFVRFAAIVALAEAENM